MNILFITNYPSPYRVDFFNELGKSVNLTVAFTQTPAQQRHRNQAWFNDEYSHFNVCFLNHKVRFLKRTFCLDIFPLLKSNYDLIIFGGYSDPTHMLAIEYLKARKIPFCMEFDGGLIKSDSRLKFAIKKRYISSASVYLSSGKATNAYLTHYGAREDAIYEYPFTSMWDSEILKESPTPQMKAELRHELGLKGQKIVVSVGNFIPRKGLDILMYAAKMLSDDIAIYIIGGEPTEEYLRLRDTLQLENVHFIGFKKKNELIKYYKAADVFALPTRSDVWGLVVSEAMAHGLPVVTTDRCVAGLELIRDGLNGYIVPVGDHEALAKAISDVFRNDTSAMSEAALNSIREYTIEKMVRRHVEVFEEILE